MADEVADDYLHVGPFTLLRWLLACWAIHITFQTPL